MAGLPPSLIGTESGGNWQAQNSEVGAGGAIGHFGRGQFGQARLQDAMDAGVIPQGMTPQQFMDDPAAQLRVETWHDADIQGFISRNGLDRYYGQTVGGVMMTPGGMLAIAHLGGNGGLRRYLESGGQYNPSDSFGTSLRDYAQTHSGGIPSGGQPSGPAGMPGIPLNNALAPPEPPAPFQYQNALSADPFMTRPDAMQTNFLRVPNA